jgi:hypothetical protein
MDEQHLPGDFPLCQPPHLPFADSAPRQLDGKRPTLGCAIPAGSSATRKVMKRRSGTRPAAPGKGGKDTSFG